MLRDIKAKQGDTVCWPCGVGKALLEERSEGEEMPDRIQEKGRVVGAISTPEVCRCYPVDDRKPWERRSRRVQTWYDLHFNNIILAVPSAGQKQETHLEPDVVIWVDQNVVVNMVGSGRILNIFWRKADKLSWWMWCKGRKGRVQEDARSGLGRGPG